MAQSNGISQITDIEARLGDLLRARFSTREGLERWAEEYGTPMLNFWDYSKTKMQGIYLAPIPLYLRGCGHDKTYLVFGDELATRILALGFIP
jgi:hypothetical protein